MASINPSNPSSNPQLAGINGTVPMPRGPAPTLADGSAFSLSPNNSLSLGGNSGDGFVITNGTNPLPTAASNTTAGSSGSILVGGGGTPANGAQPPMPGATTGATTTTSLPGTAAASGTSGASGLTMQAAGFGRADRNATMRVDTGGGASFSFPSFNASAKANTAPEISWDPSWKKVEKDGMWYMEAPNGVKAIPAVEYRITPTPADKVQTVKVANGWGKKFPDGTILVFDRKEGPYRLDPKGNKHKVELGTHTFGGVKVRVFEASVVRTLDTSGNVEVFDSRGNASKGSARGRFAAALGAADAGASTSGGGKASTDSGPSTLSGPSTSSGGGKLVSGGGVKVPLTAEQLKGNVEELTSIARGILGEVRSGNVDPARLASLQAQLNALPSGILQAAGAAGTMTGSLVGGASGPGMPPAPGSSGTGSSTNPPGMTTAAGGGANGTPPRAGVDANATTKVLAAGSKAKVEGAVPTEFHGRQARFAQLPAEVQAAVAKAFGSDQGAAAFKADQLVAFNSSGEVTLVEGGTIYLKHQAQVRGAGPGEDMAITVRPGRQPGGSANRSGAATGGGNATAATTRPTTAASGTHGHAHGTAAASNVVTVGGGSIPNPSNRIELFKAGGEMRHMDLGGITGAFTWKTLPAKAKAAILDFLRTETTDPAAKAFATRTGSGWSIDPNASIVVEAGFAQFVGGLSLLRATPTPTPAVSGGGASSQPVGHDARRPPVSGGGGIGAVSPTTAPPTPAVADPGDGHAHAH